jgi:Flp pilus assembly protein TadD/SAM-dependent methyltransferase
MSGTAPLAQRYMRALAHVPLLMIDEPERVLVIGFGVGNTTHAATLHPSVKRVEVADLSKDVLAHAEYFSDANHHVLNDPDVVVYVNDGRHHLQMQPDASYDVIALEPPPIGYAGVVSLYSREFYALARSRLRPRGYISQWLPAYQVPSETALSMVRAFLDVFPQAVLISGAESDLVLLGVKGSRIELDPEKVRLSLSNAPGVRADLDRVHLGTLREVIGTFVASAATLSWATRDVPAVTDDRPLQEYSVRSLLDFGEAVPGSLVDLTGLEAWCPRCFVDGRLIRPLEGLDTYLALLDRAYRATPAEIARLRALPATPPRVVDGSAYLGAVVPETADLHNTLGIALAEKGQIDPALEEFRQALRLDPGSSTTYWHLGAALASKGARDEALTSLQRSVQINPTNGRVQYDLALMYAQAGQFDAAVRHFRAALQLMPNSVETHDHLGRALVEANQLDEAIAHFEQALALDPGYAEAQRNLATARRLREERK